MIAITQNMTHLFHGIVKIKIAKLIYINLINDKYGYKLKNIISLEIILIIYNINKCFGVNMKLNIIFITFSGKNGGKISFNSMSKKNNKNSSLKKTFVF